jgi:hypothetical protein
MRRRGTLQWLKDGVIILDAEAVPDIEVTAINKAFDEEKNGLARCDLQNVWGSRPGQARSKTFSGEVQGETRIEPFVDSFQRISFHYY